MLPFLLFAQLRVPPALTLFPYTTLFRSFPLMDEGDPDALLSEQVGGVQGQSLLEFGDRVVEEADVVVEDRKSTRLNSSHTVISYAVFCLKKKKTVSITSTSCTASP